MVRTGIGYDIHRLVPGRPLVLGGVKIPHSLGLAGHSDADVVIHALCDALLGAAGLGDIGELFPDTDPAFRGADSSTFLSEVMRRIITAGFRVGNVDLIVLAEQPRLSPHKAAMRNCLAGLLGVQESEVGIKAGTMEGMDSVGQKLAIACMATALSVKREG